MTAVPDRPLVPLPDQPEGVPWPTRTWPRAEPGELGADVGRLTALLDELVSGDHHPQLGLTHAAAVVAPLRLARGIQNKVLEAMAMALPVIMSRAAETGIGGSAGTHYITGDSDDDLVDRVIAMVSHPRLGIAMGKEARRFVVENLSWQASLAPMAKRLGLRETRRDAA